MVLAGGLALTSAGLQAEANAAGTAADPYSPIVARNAFGLNRPSPTPPHRRDSVPPPKITLAGITTILGPADVLYKVAGGNRDGKQWQEESYIAKEGQEQDGIVVVRIDATKDQVTFVNHGIQQDIALANAPSGDEKTFVADETTAPSGARSPKPGDSNYADQQSVTAPLNENQLLAIQAQRIQYQNQVDSPTSDLSGQPAAMNNGVAGGDTPPGHGSF